MDTYSVTSAAAHFQKSPDATTAQVFTVATGARGLFVTCTTNDAYITFDGSTPSSTNGLALVKSTAPVFFPVNPKYSVKVLSTVAGGSVVNVMWVW